VHVAYLHYLYGRDTAFHHVRQFSEAARGLGHRVDVYAMNLAPPPHSPGDTRLGSFDRIRSTLKKRFGRYLHDPKELLWNVRYLRRETTLLRKEPPDVLLVRHHELGISCVPLAHRLGIPLILEVNAPAEEGRRYDTETFHLTALQEWTSRWKMRRADSIVVVSSFLKKYLTERYEIHSERISVAHNGADLQRFTPTAAPDAEFPRHDRHPRIGFVGSFQRFHGLGLLAGMVRGVASARPAARFLFVGDGPGAETLRLEAGHDDCVEFTGRVPHERVPALLASLDIAVVAEAAPHQCPLKLIEFMAAGKAIVAPRYEPIAELLVDGTHGTLFPPCDLEALITNIVELIDQPEQRSRLGQAAAERAHTTLSWQDNARKVMAACDTARQRHRTTGSQVDGGAP